MNQGIYKPGGKVLTGGITSKEDAISILENGYQLNTEIFSEIQKHLPNILLAGVDKKIIVNCKVTGIKQKKDGTNMIHVKSNENKNQTWAFPADNLCSIINNQNLLLAFSE